jgi:(S)-ureidoglycine aminohydrolase
VNLFGHTRSRIAANHALITPDTHVWGPLPGWKGATAAVHISPHLGARFMQASVVLETGRMSGGAADGMERVIFVRSGAVSIKLPGGGPTKQLSAEGFAYFPADKPHEIKATEPTSLVVFEKPFQKAPGVELPEAVIGAAADLPAEPFMGDEDARLQVLLPADERFDLAVNLFTYQPGATLPQVEIHVMEHGLIMLDGAGVYRLGDSWYPVEAGDVIWMASYCPQWFVAMGKTPARYLYYKDVNRDPLAVSIS